MTLDSRPTDGASLRASASSSEQRETTLGGAFGHFVRHPTPWILAAWVVGALILALRTFRWRTRKDG